VKSIIRKNNKNRHFGILKKQIEKRYCKSKGNGQMIKKRPSVLRRAKQKGV
jgi:hypothetical protein